MPKYYTLAFLVLLSFSVKGQIKKQSILLGGQFSYYNSKTKDNVSDNKTENGTINVSVGKAIKENKVIGFNFDFSPARQSNFYFNGDTSNLKLNIFDIGMFYREYKKLAKDLYFFCEADGSCINSKETRHYNLAAGDVKTTKRGGSISLTPGISYKVFRKVQLEVLIPNILGIRYVVSKFESNISQFTNSKQKEFLFYSNISNSSLLGYLGVGFRIIL